MSPHTTAAASTAIAQLRHLVHYNLDNDLLSNALFLAGRLHALDPRSPETLYLLAQCHLKLGHFRAAYDYSKDTRLRGLSASSSSASASSSATAVLGCNYVFAQACLALRRHTEGITALERCRVIWQGRNHWGRHSEGERARGPDAPAVCNLLGKLCRAGGEEKKAAEYFAESLKGNPFMWDAFVDMSDAGVPIRTGNVFKLTDDLRRDFFAHAAEVLHETQPPQPPPPPPPQALANKSTNDPNTPAGYDPFNPTRSAVDPGLNYGGTNLMSRLNGGNIPGISLSQPEWETPPTSNGIHFDEDVTMDDHHHHADSEAPPALPRKKTGLQGLADLIDPPKIRAMTTRGRLKPEGDPEGRPATASSIPTVSHKRTISGQPPPLPPSLSSAASDASSQGIRRSTRIQNSATAGTAASTAKTTTAASLGSRFAGVLKSDSRDRGNATLPKVRATGTKGRAGAERGTVGRVVSGNRKAMGPGERDGDVKESSRPASVASTVREAGSRRANLHQQHSSVSVEQHASETAQQQVLVLQEEEGVKYLLDLFAKLGEGYFNLSRFNAQKALDIFRSLPVAQRETPWVLSKIGRALYERAQYKEAADVFARVRKLPLLLSAGGRDSISAGGGESACTEDMHIYSTVLWHLKRDVDLSFLAHEMLALDRLAPESWVALGNSFSLQRDHDKAIKCFKRATQLSSSSGDGSSGGGGAYAWTLMGHEHVTQEEFDKATRCYREAVVANTRHYAGWYGLGSVYEKLGKYDVAEHHYRIAWNVNPRNGVLAVCLGLVCEKLGREGGGGGSSSASWVLDPRGEGRVKEALAWYERAVRMDPRSAKARFMKARTLMRLAQMPGAGGAGRAERLVQAKAELDVLREMAPEESMVHFLLGRCLKVMGDRAGAIREMTIALELDPKASPAIKEALESLEVDDDGSFDEDEDD